MKNLTRGENWVLAAIALWLSGVMVAFVVRFWGEPFDKGIDGWGQFGDYFGGMLNPIVALAALFLLKRSIGIQRKELSATRTVLDEQARSAAITASVAALTALLEANVVKAQIAREQRAYLVGQLERQTAAVEDYRLRNATGNRPKPDQVYTIFDFDGEEIPREKVVDDLDLLSQRISILRDKQEGLEQKIEALLGVQIS
jgi:hypothetical protein